MATFSSREIIDKMIAGDGWLPETGDRTAPNNPPAIRIVEYTDLGDKRTWGVVFAGDRDPYRYERPTAWVRDPQVIWTKSPPQHGGRGMTLGEIAEAEGMPDE
jgi:hypothetical protein